MLINKFNFLILTLFVIEKCNLQSVLFYNSSRGNAIIVKNLLSKTKGVPEEFETFICTTNREQQHLNCEIRFGFTLAKVVPTCHNVTNKTVHVSVYSRRIPKPTLVNPSFRCFSDYPILVSVEFKGGKPQAKYIDIHQQRITVDYLTPQSYKYEINISLPINIGYIYPHGELVHYKFYNAEDEDSEVAIFLEFWMYEAERLYLLRGSSPIEISNHVENVPCFDFRSDRRVGFYRWIDETDITHSGDEHACATLDKLFKELKVQKHQSGLYMTLEESDFIDENLVDDFELLLPRLRSSLESYLFDRYRIISDSQSEMKNNYCAKNRTVSFAVLKKALVKLNLIVEYFKTDNTSVTFDEMEGFLLNPKYFYTNISGKYTCNDRSSISYANNFSILNKEIRISPTHDTIFLRKRKYNIINQSFDKNDVTLECSHNSESMQVIFNGAGFGPGVKEIMETVEFNMTQSEEASVTRYYGIARIPALNSTYNESECFEGKWNTELFKNYFDLDCVSNQTDRTKKIWNRWRVYFDRIGPLYYSAKENLFVCADWFLMGHHFGRSADAFSLHQWKCENIDECRIVIKNCLSEDATALNVKGDCMKSMLSRSSRLCEDDDFYLDGDTYNEHCSTLVPFEKGIVQCAATSKNQMIFNIVQTYFMGFDDHFYMEMGMNEEPPLNAILRITRLPHEDDRLSREIVYTKETYTYRCEAHSFFHHHGLQWFITFFNGTEIAGNEKILKSFEGEKSSTNPISYLTVYIEDRNVKQIVCSAPVYNTNRWNNISMDIKTEDSLSPRITSVEPKAYLAARMDQSITCRAEGMPTPRISWSRIQNGEEQPIQADDQLNAAGQTVLLLKDFDESLTGTYLCRATNVAGNDTRNFQVKEFSERESISVYIYYTVGGVGLILATVISILMLIYLRQEKLKRQRAMKEITYILKGSETGNYKDNDGNFDPIKFPFNKEMEIKKNYFIIDRHKMLGNGQFGEVFKGILKGENGAVAFKTVRKNSPMMHLRALASELKILMYIGKHENVVTLLGAYIEEIRNGILYVAIELCDLGSLESYLRTHRHLFLQCPILRKRGKSDYVQIGSVNRDYDGYEDPYNQLPHSVFSLIKWSFQIANGMEYLGEKNVVHSDLATRNVLLTAYGCAKVTDFGLSRRMYAQREYVKTSQDPLPWRWSAIESLTTNVFSVKSDVWAYGVTLWEIATLGDVPYPGMEYSLEFIQELQNGHYMQRPTFGSTELYKLIRRCWSLNPDERPTFSALKSIFQLTISKNSDKVIEVENLEELENELAALDYIAV